MSSCKKIWSGCGRAVHSHEKIAKDFANYLELYYKYQMDYQLDAVLQGKIDPLLLKKAGNASFDERLSVLSLLLARCRRAFAAIFQKRAELELLFGELKKLRMQLLEEEAVTEPPAPGYRRQWKRLPGNMRQSIVRSF